MPKPDDEGDGKKKKKK